MTKVAKFYIQIRKLHKFIHAFLLQLSTQPKIISLFVNNRKVKFILIIRPSKPRKLRMAPIEKERVNEDVQRVGTVS